MQYSAIVPTILKSNSNSGQTSSPTEPQHPNITNAIDCCKDAVKAKLTSSVILLLGARVTVFSHQLLGF